MYMKRVLIVLMLCLVSIMSFSQNYAIQEWDYIGKRIKKTAYQHNLKFNQVGYHTFTDTDTTLFCGKQPKVSLYIWNEYQNGCKTYDEGTVLTCLGAGLLFISAVMTMHVYSHINHFGDSKINPKFPIILSAAGGLSMSVGVTFLLVGRCDKHACNISTYKDYNYNNY